MKFYRNLVSVVLAGILFAALPLSAKQATSETKPAPTTKKETKWQGSVVRIYKDSSEMDIRGGINTRAADIRKVAYDNSTQWTNQGKPGQTDQVKEGSFVIVLGKVDGKGILHATRIDLRSPR
jgi:hypothetical protein